MGIKHFLLVWLFFAIYTGTDLLLGCTKNSTHFIALIIFFSSVRGDRWRGTARVYYCECVYFWHKSFLLSLTGIVVLVVVVGKQQLLPTVFLECGKRGTGRGGESENIRPNQMQIERFAVGNFQFSSPCCQHASRPPQTRRRYCPSIWIPEKQTWN